MLLNSQHLNFINSANFLNIILKKKDVQTEPIKGLLLSITTENTNFDCIFDNYISNPIYIDSTRHFKKYSYISLIEGTFQTFKGLKLQDPKHLTYKFKENFFFNQFHKSLNNNHLKVPNLNLHTNIFLRKFTLYKPTKGGFFGYWLGFFGYISKRSAINFAEYSFKKFRTISLYFSIIFNYIKLYFKLLPKKKKIRYKFDFRIHFNSIFYFR